MILLDPRTGSADLALYIRPKTLVKVSKKNIPADAAFSGRGPKGKKLSIGIEVKKIPDFLQCIADGRFSGHQLLEMHDRFDVNYMVIEGIWRRNIENGMFEVLRDGWRSTGALQGQKGWRWAAIDGWMNSLSILAGVRFLFTCKREETALAIRNLYHWWNDKEWEDHQSHLRPHILGGGTNGLGLTPPGYTQTMLMQLPGIRDTWRDFVRAFGSVEGLCMASIEEIAAVKIGKKITKGARKRAFGRKNAEAVWKALRNQ